MRAAVGLDDDARVAALHRLGVLDQPPAADLEGLTRLATFVTGAPASVLNLIDTDRQWQAAATGLVCTEVPRSESMCAHVVAADRAVHVADASTDVRFADTAYVDGRLGSVRMYASVPVHDHEGYAVGTLCVVDPVARDLSAAQLAALHDLAAQAEHLLEMRRQHLMLLDVLAEVDHFASHDPLTGLVNRRVLLDRLDLALQRAERTGVPPTLLFCDVDGFKAVNDTLGHQAGDEALVAVARHLRALVRGHDTVARLGGDEFVILCEDVTPAGAAAVVERLRRPVEANHGLSLSVGLSTPCAPCTAAQALDGADALMYADKVHRRVP
jgi:diguanylate cyclase (GGDEF)-like protein